MEADPREELATLAAALRAHLEVNRSTGAFELRPATADLIAARTGAVAVAASTRTGGEPPSESSPAPEPAHVPPVESTRAVDIPRPGATTDDRQTRLAVLASEAKECTRCALHAARKQAVFSRGTGSSGLVFVGEGPGADEDEQGFPFVGKAGQLLDKMIEAMGFSRDEIYVCNIVKCRPPNNRKPEPSEMASCRPFLIEQLELLEPKVIVALGATAVEGLLGVTGGITRLRGTWRLYRGSVPVMPTFHPAYLLRTAEAKRDVWNDLQEVVRHMGRALPAKK